MSKRILTTEILTETVPMLLRRGSNAQQIADILGCKYNTLKVRCSQAGVSLRGPNGERPPRQQRSVKVNIATLDMLREKALAAGVTEIDIANRLLRIIAEDNLYNAILDDAA